MTGHLHVSPGPQAKGITKRELAPGRQRLLALFQQVRYGRVHRLRVTSGEPDWSEPVPWTRTVKVLGENDAHPASGRADYMLREEVSRFLDLLTAVGDGEILNIEVRNGLPFTFETRGVTAV